MTAVRAAAFVAGSAVASFVGFYHIDHRIRSWVWARKEGKR